MDKKSSRLRRSVRTRAKIKELESYRLTVTEPHVISMHKLYRMTVRK